MRLTMKHNIGDTVSYQELTGKIINVFDAPAGTVLEIECPAKVEGDLDTILWIPEAELSASKKGAVI
jgi:hypothetical protein